MEFVFRVRSICRLAKHRKRNLLLRMRRVPIVVMKKTHRAHSITGLLYSHRLIWWINNLPSTKFNIHITAIRSVLSQGIGRLFRCLCNPAFDVDDEEIVYRGRWYVMYQTRHFVCLDRREPCSENFPCFSATNWGMPTPCLFVFG